MTEFKTAQNRLLVLVERKEIYQNDSVFRLCSERSDKSCGELRQEIDCITYTEFENFLEQTGNKSCRWADFRVDIMVARCL